MLANLNFFLSYLQNTKAINICRIKNYLLKKKELWYSKYNKLVNIRMAQSSEVSELLDWLVPRRHLTLKARTLQTGKNPITIRSVSYYYTSVMPWALERSKNSSLCRAFSQEAEKEQQLSQYPKQRKQISSLISARNAYRSLCLIRPRQIWKLRIQLEIKCSMLSSDSKWWTHKLLLVLLKIC